MYRGLVKNARPGVAVVLAAILTAGCGLSPVHRASLQESLDIRVLPNTSKLFTYRLVVPESQRRPRVRPYDSVRDAREDRRPREPLGEGAYRELRARAQEVVRQTGYCRDGVLELDYRLSREEMWFRGECREAASEADMERFGEQSELAISETEE